MLSCATIPISGALVTVRSPRTGVYARPIDVVCEDDATPLVLIIATQLRRAIADPEVARKAEDLRGVFALKSQKDPQAVTMRFENGNVRLERGVANDAQVVVTADLDNMNGPDAPKPKVAGAIRHPRFALGVSKLLDAPAPPWQTQARAFWTYAQTVPDVPAHLRVVCIDDGAAVDLGTPATDQPAYEIHGSAPALASVFSGGSVFGQDLLEGKLFSRGSLKDMSILTGCSINWMLRGGS
jgi:hypothetical protein